MKRLRACGWMTAPLLLGCLGADPAPPSGNPALGIAEFTLEETPARTVVLGVDAAGAVVGSLELVHGRFALTGLYRDDYDTAEVVGRQLHVSIAGQELVWETAGFEPTLRMPAHPPGRETLAAFLADPHVKAVLDRWAIGFEGAAALAARHYVAVREPGTLVVDCSHMDNCGPVRTFTANTCGAGGAADMAFRITRAAPNGDEDLIAQCCPVGTGILTVPWFAIKVCPTSGTESTCGSTTSACKGCPGYPAPASELCHIRYEAGAIEACYSDDGTAPATVLVASSPPQLWPPDHARVDLDLASCLDTIEDPCDPGLTAEAIVGGASFTIDYIGSDEPGAGEISRTGPSSVSVRRARDGGGDGRVYHVGISYTNRFGLTTSLDCRYGVPHDRGRRAVAIDGWSGPAGAPGNPGFVIFAP